MRMRQTVYPAASGGISAKRWLVLTLRSEISCNSWESSSLCADLELDLQEQRCTHLQNCEDPRRECSPTLDNFFVRIRETPTGALLDGPAWACFANLALVGPCLLQVRLLAKRIASPHGPEKIQPIPSVCPLHLQRSCFGLITGMLDVCADGRRHTIAVLARTTQKPFRLCGSRW
jgi:hypothetical protein